MKHAAADFLDRAVTRDRMVRVLPEPARGGKNGSGRTGPCPPAAHAARGIALCINPRMRAILTALTRLAASDVPVVFQGETGVGKEVLARELHALSPRASRPFLKLNCAAVPLELLESELFGYERGAFTGALGSKPGKFELADGGTILFDEIGDMDVKLQAKLLHVLQDNEFQRLGGTETVRVDVRVVTATHCDLQRELAAGRFRKDLYYRLSVARITIPPLRERKDEVLALARHFLEKHAVSGTQIPDVTPALERALLAYDWPGNVRELENVIRRFLVFGDEELLIQELAAELSRLSSGAEAFPVDPEELVLERDGDETCPTLARVHRARDGKSVV